MLSNPPLAVSPSPPRPTRRALVTSNHCAEVAAGTVGAWLVLLAGAGLLLVAVVRTAGGTQAPEGR